MSDRPTDNEATAMTNELSVAYDPTTGVMIGERLGRKITVDELVAWSGYERDNVFVDPESIEAKTWPTSMKLQKRGDGGEILDTVPIQVWNHYLRIKIKPRHDETVSASIRDELIAEIRAEKAGASDPVPPSPRTEEGVVVELDLFDPHFQMLAWGPETGSHQDLDIISDRYVDAVCHLVGRAVRDDVSRWLIPVGQDLFHTDKYLDGKSGTTARGTPQDVDTRLAKAAGRVRKILTDIVLELLSVAPVDILIVPGTHDTERSWWMGEVLDARFEGNDHVRVDNRPLSRKYYRIGNSMIGFSHGHNLKPRDFRDYMSQEARKDWAETIYREWHLGHFHHERTLDERGVLVRYLPSLAGTDAWHFQQGFTHSQRGAKAYVWTQDRGVIETIHYSVPVTEEEMSFTAPMLRGDD